MADQAMKKIFRIGRTVGWFSAWWARPNQGFIKPGVYLWILRKNFRVLPLFNTRRG